MPKLTEVFLVKESPRKSEVSEAPASKATKMMSQIGGPDDTGEEGAFYANKKVENIIFNNCSGFSERDFLDLAMACLDQSGMGLNLQNQIEKLIMRDYDSAET